MDLSRKDIISQTKARWKYRATDQPDEASAESIRDIGADHHDEYLHDKCDSYKILF